MHNKNTAVPPALRAIFARWAEPCDPARRPDASGEAAAAMYRALSLADTGTTVQDAQLSQVAADARHNQQFGQFAELRREGEQVLRWVCAVLAAGPAPQHMFVPY